MSRETPRQILFAVAMVFMAGGCLYYEEPDDPFAEAIRDAAAAERRIVRRGRRAPWFLVKASIRDVAADAPAHDGLTPDIDARLASSLPTQRARAQAAGLRVSLGPPPEEALEESHETIMVREGEAGFAALARGIEVARPDDESAAVGGRGIDVGFAVTVSGDVGGRLAVELVPALRQGRPGGHEERVARLAFGSALAPGEALVIDAAPDASHTDVRALFFEGARGGRRLRMHLQVEALR